MTIWDKIIRVSVVLAAIYYILATTYKIYSVEHKRIVDEEKKVQREMAFERKVDSLARSVSITIIRIDTLITNQNRMIIRLDENTKSTKAVNAGFKKHLKSTDRLEELLQFYEF